MPPYTSSFSVATSDQGSDEESPFIVAVPAIPSASSVTDSYTGNRKNKYAPSSSYVSSSKEGESASAIHECAVCLGRDGDQSGTVRFVNCVHSFCLPCVAGTWRECPLCQTRGKVHYKRGDRDMSIVALRDALATAKKNDDEYNRRVIHVYLSMATLSGGRGTLDDMDEGAIMLNDAFRGFTADDPTFAEDFSPYGPEFAAAAGEYAERAILCERGSLQLTAAIDDNLVRWNEAPDCHYSSPFQHSMGKALRRLGRVDDAVKHLERSTEIDPQSPENWGNLGIALRQRGDLQQADEAQRRAIALAPEVGIGHHNLGNVLMELNELPEALESLDQAVEYGIPTSMESSVERAREVIRDALRCKCKSCRDERNTTLDEEGNPKRKKKILPTFGKDKVCRKTVVPLSPWLVLILDTKGNCELTNEDGSAVNKDGSRMVFGGEVDPKMIMEHYGVRIRRVDRVNYPLV